MNKRPPCLNCDGPNNGTGDLCSACYINLGRRPWTELTAGALAGAGFHDELMDEMGTRRASSLADLQKEEDSDPF